MPERDEWLRELSMIGVSLFTLCSSFSYARPRQTCVSMTRTTVMAQW